MRKTDTTFIAPIAQEVFDWKMGKTGGAMPGTPNMPKELETLTAQHRQFIMKLVSLVKREVFYGKHNEKTEPVTPHLMCRETLLLANFYTYSG